MDWKLEVVVVPVSDVERAKAFYTEGAGFDLDHDVTPGGDMRVIQLTPPGSACSIVIGSGMTAAEPGSVRGLQLVVSDMDAAREALIGRGVEVSEVRQMGDRDGGRFAFFEDPDGNGWSVQEIRGRAARAEG